MNAPIWNLADVVRTNGRLRPDAPAITYGPEVISWSELDQRSNRAASALEADRIRAGDRVAFVGKNSPAYFEVLFGAAKLSAVTVAVNWRLHPSEMGFIVKDAGARLLVVDEEFTDAAELVGSAEKVVVLGPHAIGPASTPYGQWLGEREPVDPGHVAGAAEVALQLYTSGTTGLPKGAMLTNANMGFLVSAADEMFGIDSDSVSLVVLPVFHIGGVGYALICMAQGCHTVLLRDFDPPAVLEALTTHRVTNALFVPAMLGALCAVPGAADRDYSALRSIIYGASPITEESLKAALTTFGRPFVQVYGMTETTGAITQLAAADHDPDGPRSHLLRSGGKPFSWVETRIVDPATGEDRSPGEIGELWTRSPQNMAGYWNNERATAETITADGWLRTGDAGYIDDEGYLFLTDRVKDMIVTGAENVYPIEVENVLASHPAVADVAVIGVPDPRWGETVKAVVVLRPGAEVEADELIDFSRARIAHFKCPTSVDFIESLPRNPSGKILKRELREPYWRGLHRNIG
jgi:acyl-CoA synthetase (AMP-forming)/AMP-acid ligase II